MRAKLIIFSLVSKYSKNILQRNFFALVGRAGFEPAKVKTNRFTVCPRWPLEYLPSKLLYHYFIELQPEGQLYDGIKTAAN